MYLRTHGCIVFQYAQYLNTVCWLFFGNYACEREDLGLRDILLSCQVVSLNLGTCKT